jgi:regulatory protein
MRGTSATPPGGTAKDRALRLLGVRWRSREELRRRLLRAGFEPGEIADTLEDLERAGLVHDERFARELVRDQTRRRLAGDRVIRSALREKGVAPEVAEAALGGAGDEAERATELARRKAERMRGLAPDAAHRRLYGVLLRRGFSHGLATEAARSALAAIFPGDRPGVPDGP